MSKRVKRKKYTPEIIIEEVGKLQKGLTPVERAQISLDLLQTLKIRRTHITSYVHFYPKGGGHPKFTYKGHWVEEIQLIAKSLGNSKLNIERKYIGALLELDALRGL